MNTESDPINLEIVILQVEQKKLQEAIKKQGELIKELQFKLGLYERMMYRG